MSRYRKIEVRTWSDEKFRELSPIAPSGQSLWFFLLTGPHTTAIPGLFRAGRAAMAEELNWDQEDFDKAFKEVSDKGMAKADFKAKLVWLPKAIQHNKPESPNVVRGWRVELDLLPECDLKSEAIGAIRDALKIAGSSYLEAFDEVISGIQKGSSKPSGKANAKPSKKAIPNQEQEQEQEQEQKETPTVEQKPLDLSVQTVELPEVDPVETIFAFWQKVMSSPRSALDSNRKRLITNALKNYSAADICKAIRGCSKSPYNMGQNQQKTKYNGLDLILRNAEKIDRFIQLDSSQAVSQDETLEERNARLIREVMAGEGEGSGVIIEMEP